MSSSSKKNPKKENELGKALKSSGVLLPETEDEVKAFYEIYGDTKVELPAKLQNSDFLYDQKDPKIISIIPGNEEFEVLPQLAYAAREGQDELPDHIMDKMKDLKKKAREKKKSKK